MQDCYTSALDVAPAKATKQRAVFLANRAACCMRQEDYPGVVQDCSAALELDEGYLKALLRRAAAYEELDDIERALVDLKKVLELDPGNAGVAARVDPLEKRVEARREEMKEEMMGKLKELGNGLLSKIGLSMDNFQMQKDPATGSYSIKFQQ